MITPFLFHLYYTHAGIICQAFFKISFSRPEVGGLRHGITLFLQFLNTHVHRGFGLEVFAVLCASIVARGEVKSFGHGYDVKSLHSWDTFLSFLYTLIITGLMLHFFIIGSRMTLDPIFSALRRFKGLVQLPTITVFSYLINIASASHILVLHSSYFLSLSYTLIIAGLMLHFFSIMRFLYERGCSSL